ncbi:MAG: hypothetical protein L6R36_007840 [Xanthoria steineri]|nr:MAG: hypothetical protein L6R36_007840 [Xanthoria steineri]
MVIVWKVELGVSVELPPGLPLRLRQRRSVHPAGGLVDIKVVDMADIPDGIVVACKVELDADVAPPTRTPLRLKQRRSVHPAGGLVGTEGVVVVCKVDVDVALPPGLPLRLRQRRSVHPAAGVLEDAEAVVVKDIPDGMVGVWKVELGAADVDVDVAPPPRMPLRLRQRRSVQPATVVLKDAEVIVDVCKVDVGVEPPPGLPLRLRQRRSVHAAAAVLDDPEVDVVLSWPLIVLVLPKENEVVDVVTELFEFPDKLVDEFPAVLELPTSLGDMQS